MRPAAIFALLLALLIAQPAAAQPYMRDPARVTDVLTNDQVLIGLITEERRTQAVPADFAEHQLRDLPGAREYALSRADDTGQGARIRRDANARTAAILNARQLPAWMTGYPTPARVVDDIRRELAGQEEQGFVSGGRIMGRLTLLRETLRRQAQEQGGPMSPAAMRLFILYEIYQSDISHRLSNDLIIERNCSFFWGVFNRCDHQQYLSNANAYLNSVEETKELYFPIERRYLFTQAAAKAPIEIRHPRTLPPWYWYAGLVAAIGIPLLLILLFAFRWKGVAWLKKVFDWLASLFKSDPPPRPTTFGSADYAPRRTTIPHENAYREGLFLGLSSYPGAASPGATLFTTPETHTLIVARSRTGKGTRVILPTLCLYSSSMFVIDPKGQNAAVTARYRRDVLGQSVHIINPWGQLGGLFESYGFAAAALNPLDILNRDDPNVVATARSIAETICVQGNPAEPFWQRSATALLTGLLLWVTDQPGETKTLERVTDLLTGGEKMEDVRATLLTKMCASRSFKGAMRKQVSSFIGLRVETWASIVGQLSDALQFASDPRVHDATERSSFAISEIVNGQTTVFIIIPDEQMEAQTVWLRLIIGAITQTYKRERPAAHGIRGMFLIDELGQMGRFESLVKDIAIMSGTGLDYTLIVQSLSQLRRDYGNEGADTILGNCAWKWFCNVNDLATAKYISESLGQMTVQTVTRTISEGAEGKTSHAHGEAGRSLLFPDEIMALGRNIAFGFNPTERPHYLRTKDYWDLPFPLEADPDPFHAQEKRQSPPQQPAAMTRERALKLFTLKEGATEAEIKAAYKRMMAKVHPDTGGNDEFAQTINQARDVLLKRG